MELRIINAQPFIVTRPGKHDVVRTPDAAIAAERAEIARANIAIEALREREQQAQAAIEAALLAGLPTAQPRADLAAILEETQGFKRDREQARSAIAQVLGLVEARRAAEIRQSDLATLATITQPLDAFLKEHA